MSSPYYYNCDVISLNVEVRKLTSSVSAESEMVPKSTGVEQQQWFRSILECVYGKGGNKTVINTNRKVEINTINKEGFDKRRLLSIRLADGR